MRRNVFGLIHRKFSCTGIGAVILVILVLVGIGTGAGFWLHGKKDKPVMRIGTYAVPQEHLALYETDLRAKVSSYFYNTYHQDPNEEGFWEKTFHGESPSVVLREEAMNALLQDTVERMEAVNYGIAADITLDEIKKSLEIENKRRAEPGQITYGPETYGLMEYISRTQMEVRDALKEKLLETELKPTKEQLREVYDNTDPSYFDRGCKARVGIYMYYGMKVGEFPEELALAWKLVKEEVEKGTEPEAILEAVRAGCSASIEYEEVEYDTSQMPRDNERLAWLADQTRELSPGQCSGVVDYGTSQGMFWVLDKTDYGKAGFEESEPLLINLWINENYPKYLNQRMDAYR